MYREEIDAYIDGKKDEMLEDLKTLVRIDSKRGPAREGKPFGEGASAALETARNMMRTYGLVTKNYDNYVVTGDLSDAPKELDILAHLDVVPVTEDWTVTKPFEPKVVDGKLYGRGSADDKGPAIAALYALRAIRELNIPMKKSVRLVLGSDEECGSGDLRYYYGIEKEAPYTFTPDADFPLINIEKGRFEGEFNADFEDSSALPRVLSLKSGDKANVVPARAKLVLEGISAQELKPAVRETEKECQVGITAEEKDGRLEVSLHGLAAHASTPQEGKNALTAALRLVSKLPLADSEGYRALCALNRLLPYEDTCGKALGIYREEAQSGAVTVCFSIFAYSPDHMQGTFDARLPIGCTEENTKLPIQQQFAACNIHLADTEMIRPHCVPGDSDFVKILLDSYEHYSGCRGEALSTGGGTYVHELERGVAFGCMMPGVDNHMHGDDEFIEIDTLIMSAKIFADAVIRICNEL